MKNQLLLILSVITIGVSAQQFSLPSQLNNSRLHLNPAFSGSFGTTVASLTHRTNWLGASGALNLQNFEMHSPLRKQAIALGLQARHESIGSGSTTEVFFNYAYRIRIKKDQLTFGLRGGVQSRNMSDIFLEEELDPAFETIGNLILPNFGIGISYYSPNYFIGFSIPYLFNSVLANGGSQSIEYDSQKYSYIISGGLNYKLSTNIKLKSIGAFSYSALLKPSYCAVVNTLFKESFELGVGYRGSRALIFNAGYHISKQASFMYTFDYNMGDVALLSKSSHEIGILLHWGYKVKTINPRDF